MIARRAMFLAPLLAAAPAAAHHGWGSYDVSKVFTIEAPVERLDWSNPHAHLRLKYQGEEWEATLAPLSRMQLRGLSEAMLKPGTVVRVAGHPSTRIPREMRPERITVAGKTVELRRSSKSWPPTRPPRWAWPRAAWCGSTRR
jgi:hypothetical protein